MQRIETTQDIARGLEALVMLDPRLHPVIEGAGDIPLRRSEPGFASLCSIVVSQQVSRASADAIDARLRRLIDPLTPENLLAGGPTPMIEAGLSRPKQKTLAALAGAIHHDGLDLLALCAAPPDTAMDRLVAIPGIGPWTAEIYLLFCAGHPDIFPARDLALQAAVADWLGLENRPDHRALTRIAESWAPWRGVAARLFWSHYRQIKGREGAPAARMAQNCE
jgi:DNA-3-methyladenine glycosylase II